MFTYRKNPRLKVLDSKISTYSSSQYSILKGVGDQSPVVKNKIRNKWTITESVRHVNLQATIIQM